MLKETAAGNRVAAAVQDALTGEVLWVGFLDSSEPGQLAKTGIFRTVGLASGKPVAIRHLSPRGEGLVIHVEGPSTRNQLDSIMPEPRNPFNPTELEEYAQPIATLRDSGKWTKSPSTLVSSAAENATVSLVDSFRSLLNVENGEKAEAIAERAAKVLWALLNQLGTLEVPLAMTLEAFDRHRHD